MTEMLARIAARSSNTLDGSRLKRLVLLCFALSGTASLIYEVAWFRDLTLAFGSTTYATATMLAAFMSGLALGSFLAGKASDDPRRDRLSAYIDLELLIAATGVASMIALRWLPQQHYFLGSLAARSWILYFIGQVGVTYVVLLIPTTLMGATFPFVLRIIDNGIEDVGRSSGAAYSANTLGAVAGPIIGGFLLIPALGVERTVAVAAALNVLIAILLILRTRPQVARRRILPIAGILVVGFAMATLHTPPVVESGLYRAIRHESLQSMDAATHGSKTLFDAKSVYGRVSVVENAGGILTLHNGGKIEGSTEPVDRVTMRLAARLPEAIALAANNASPTGSAFVIGLGTGYTSRETLEGAYDRIVTAEINEDIIEAARFFTEGAFIEDERHEFAVTDARWHLAAYDQKYDLVTSEPSWPVSSQATPLFTRDFFELVNSRLSDDGVFCQWLPQYLLEKRDFKMMYKTFSDVFPEATVWIHKNDLFLVGMKNGRIPDEELVLDRVEDVIPGARLEVFANKDLLEEALADDVPINTDDKPLLESAVARNLVKQLGDATRDMSREQQRGGLRTR